MKNLVRFALGAALVLGLTGCMPRGETKTLAEVLSSAQARYSDVSKAGLPADVTAVLDKVSADLQALTASDDVAGAAEKVAAVGDSIAGLVNKAGFTSRAALNEISLQYRALGSGAADSITPAQVKLLASRTYSVLAAELETTKFAL